MSLGHDGSTVRVLQADQANFQEWQKQMAVDRSRGHFFKSLYQARSQTPTASCGLRDPQASIREKASPRVTAERILLVVLV